MAMHATVHRKKKYQGIGSRSANERLADAYEQIGKLVVQDAQLNCPIDSGELRRSIKYRIVRGGGRIQLEVYSDAYYATFVEKGTRAHIIEPKNAKALRFQVSRGKYVFAKRVHHPGTAPQPFLQPALDQNRENIKRILSKVYRR